MTTLVKWMISDETDWAGPKVTHYLFNNPTVFITFVYILISGLGLIYEMVYFSVFKINILDYSEPADFFLAAFKRPGALLAGSGLVISLVIYKVMADYARHHKNLYIKFLILAFSFIGLLRKEVLIPFGLLYFVLLFAFAAENEAHRLVHGSGTDTAVKISTRFGDTHDHNLIPIGATEKFFFGIRVTDVFRNELAAKGEVSPEVTAIPFGNIVSTTYNPVTFKKR